MQDSLRIIDILGKYLDGKIIDQLVSNGKFASSTLLNSITHTVSQTLEGVEVVGTMVYYGKFVITGRKAGAKGVPIQVIIDWLKVKGIESDLVKAKSIAFAIQKTIKEKGIKPFPFIEKAIEGSLSEIDLRVMEIGRPIIKKELDVIFQIVK